MKMTMEKVYISGPITGYDLQERRAAFSLAAEYIIRKGGQPVNPLELGSDPGLMDYAAHMGTDITALLRGEAVMFLPGWHASDGCTLEFAAARIYGKHIMFYDEEEG